MYVIMTPEATAPPYSNAIVEVELPLHNHAALEQLKQERDRLSIEVAATGAAGIATSLTVSPIGLFFFALAYPPTIRVEKLTRIITVMEALLNEFESSGIRIFPTVAQPEGNPIDLFVQFPKKAHILISIRSKGNGQVIYNEERTTLYFKRGEKGRRIWLPCPLTELGDYAMWMNKNRLMFGMSSKEIRNLPLAKVLALWEPTRLNRHRQHLDSTVGSVERFAITGKGVAFLIMKEEVTDFIKAYLASYEKKSP
jgi:hypothetical protein